MLCMQKMHKCLLEINKYLLSAARFCFKKPSTSVKFCGLALSLETMNSLEFILSMHLTQWQDMKIILCLASSKNSPLISSIYLFYRFQETFWQVLLVWLVSKLTGTMHQRRTASRTPPSWRWFLIATAWRTESRPTVIWTVTCWFLVSR